MKVLEMARKSITGGLFALALLAATPATAQEPITRDQIEQMFDNIRAETPWEIDGPMLWGYFFTGADRGRLTAASASLEQAGYRRVEIRPIDGGLWLLHVEKIERHTVDSLAARNTELYGLARALGLESYDGMDVGPAPR